ncbi:MAG: hypothetical protein AB7V39_25005, partial [Nitrospiraceae bacterium]
SETQTRVDPDQSLPPLVAPSTKTPVQFNQQVNYYVPSSAWDRLSPDQVYDLAKNTLRTAETIDKRQFEYAMVRLNQRTSREKLNAVVGGAIAIAGLAGAVYLGSLGHDVIATAIAAPLATIIAIVVGRKLPTS